MISKAKVKYIKSLQVKKYRLQEQSFVVEGAKSVIELLKSDFVTTWVAATEDFIRQNETLLRKHPVEVVPASVEQISSLGTFQTNDAAIAIASIKPNRVLSMNEKEIVLVLDSIRDPGNLGTIIRTADWYGIKSIIASDDTADVYNTKVISASMGSFCRVAIQYTSLVEYLTAVSKPIYGTFLEGKDVHAASFTSGGYVVIGNEANGISSPIEKLVTHKITIPRFGKAESLNAGIATAIVLDVIRQSQK